MATTYGNLQKHFSNNPIQRHLMRRFETRTDELVRFCNPGRALDAGCGEGFTLQRLNGHSLGVDLCPLALTCARYRLAAPLHQGDITRLPFADNSFDLVLCLEVLEHLPDPLAGLRELLRVSRRYALVSVPHEPYFRLANLLRGKHLAAWGNDPEHLQNFTGPDFVSRVGHAGRLLWRGYSFPWQIALIRKRADTVKKDDAISPRQLQRYLPALIAINREAEAPPNTTITQDSLRREP